MSHRFQETTTAARIPGNDDSRDRCSAASRPSDASEQPFMRSAFYMLADVNQRALFGRRTGLERVAVCLNDDTTPTDDLYK